MLKASQKADEAGALDRRVDVEGPGEMRRLVGHDADRLTAKPREADEDVPSVVLVHLEELTLVDDGANQIAHVVGLVGLLRHQVVKRRVLAIDRVPRPAARGVVKVVGGQEAEQGADQRKTRLVVRHDEMRHTALRVMGHCAAELLLGHHLVGDGLDDVRPGDEHVARLVHHDREVGDGRRVHGAAGARAHDGGDLRHDTGRQRVAEKDIGVAAERQHPLLDPRATRVVQPDDRRPRRHRQIHDLDDLGGVGLRQRPAKDGEILREDVDETTIDAAAPGDDTITRYDPVLHPEVAAPMGDELVHLVERAGVEEQIDPLARGELAGGVLAGDARLATTKQCAPLVVLEPFVFIYQSGDRPPASVRAS